MKELLSRINVFLRRNKLLISPSPASFSIGRFTFTPQELKLAGGEETITLTQREAELLTFLCEHPDKVLRREDILLHVWERMIFSWGEVWMFFWHDYGNCWQQNRLSQLKRSIRWVTGLP
ncbi:MAG: winged helix-turn-helix domain-containing protein [Bacteroidota bacterium]